eukprot:51640-Pelagomonas_calceolata.AAC.6
MLTGMQLPGPANYAGARSTNSNHPHSSRNNTHNTLTSVRLLGPVCCVCARSTDSTHTHRF